MRSERMVTCSRKLGRSGNAGLMQNTASGIGVVYFEPIAKLRAGNDPTPCHGGRFFDRATRGERPWRVRE